MRCLNCKRTRRNNTTKSKCWREHQLCGMCNHKAHPEDYPNSITPKVYAGTLKNNPRNKRGRRITNE